MKRLRIYIDTSVVGGVFDDKFEGVSRSLFDMARRGEITLLVSDLLVEELEGAPLHVREFIGGLPAEATEVLMRGNESRVLRDAYVDAKVVGPASVDDAYHVAMATVAGADLIVSWNFRHLVHWEKIRGFNSVNLRSGYGMIDIRSPKEVVPDESD